MGKIVYRFSTPVYPDNIIYVNLVARYACNNDCLFCSRPRSEKAAQNIYEEKAGTSLYLMQPPSAIQVMAEVARIHQPEDRELAIVGLGEPLLYFSTAEEVVKATKQSYPQLKTRIDTNGLVRAFHRDAAARLAQAGLNEIRISLNALTSEEYERLCRPQCRDAFQNLTTFVRECLAAGIDTRVSYVTNFPQAPMHTPEELIDFALSLGVRRNRVVFREYVQPV